MDPIDDLVPPGGMYARVPIPAVKYLVLKKMKTESRVLIALCLHLGKSSNIVFPGYSTIATFANVSENNIKAALENLKSLGFISIEKKRTGKKSQNIYRIEQKAYLDSRKAGTKTNKTLDFSKRWICTSCYNFVESADVQYSISKDWEGKPDNHWRHLYCNGSARIQPESPGLLSDRENYFEYLRVINSENMKPLDTVTSRPEKPRLDYQDPWAK